MVVRCSAQTQNLLGHNIELFKYTQAWPLAQAVAHNNTGQIARLLTAEPGLVDVREIKFGQTLLMWAVYTNHYQSAKALLVHGANPNLRDTSTGVTALIVAADNYDTSDYIRLLLEYKADPNLAATDSLEANATPLIAAAYNRLESVKLLVDAGANANYVAPFYKSALHAALLSSKVDIVRYFLLERKVDFKQPIAYTYNGEPIKVVNSLRRLVFPLESKEYRIKMEVVEYLKNHGENYWESPVPKHYLRNYSKDYLSRY